MRTLIIALVIQATLVGPLAVQPGRSIGDVYVDDPIETLITSLGKPVTNSPDLYLWLNRKSAEELRALVRGGRVQQLYFIGRSILPSTQSAVEFLLGLLKRAEVRCYVESGFNASDPYRLSRGDVLVADVALGIGIATTRAQGTGGSAGIWVTVFARGQKPLGLTGSSLLESSCKDAWPAIQEGANLLPASPARVLGRIQYSTAPSSVGHPALTPRGQATVSEDATQGSVVRAGDELRTGEMGSLVLDLGSGVWLRLGRNTIVALQHKGGAAPVHVEWKGGELRVATNGEGAVRVLGPFARNYTLTAPGTDVVLRPLTAWVSEVVVLAGNLETEFRVDTEILRDILPAGVVQEYFMGQEQVARRRLGDMELRTIKERLPLHRSTYAR